MWSLLMIVFKDSDASKFLGGAGEGDTPDPIPNSAVKPFLADGTTHKSVGE